MPDTVRTPDGRPWYLQSDKDLEELVARCAGEEAAAVVRRIVERKAEEETRALTDADVYEEELNELTMAASGWANSLDGIAAMAAQRRVTKAMLAESIRSVAREINSMI